MVPCELREGNTFFFCENKQKVKEAFKLSLERGVVSFLVEKGGELFLRGGDPANKIERYSIAQFGKACVLMSGTIPTRNSSSYFQINIENSKAITDYM